MPTRLPWVKVEGGMFFLEAHLKIWTSYTNNIFCRFLLKYISRDEVVLLERGNGGLADVEEVVNRFGEHEPLYGFIHYRRRKVVLKYIPEGTSRLLQGEPSLLHTLQHTTKMRTARVTVQFQSVIERFSPHDTVFSFAQSTDLKDSTLSSACLLHTATAPIKSSFDSLPPKSLAEITEDISESQADADDGRLSRGGITGDGEQAGHERLNGFASADRSRHRSTSATTHSSFRSRTTSNTDKPLPPPPQPPEDYLREERSPGSTLDYGEYNTRLSMEGRFSSNSTRPSTKDLYDAYGYKKKIKMGPRPSIDSVGAPNHSGTRIDEFRPVSTLPAGLRMPSRKAVPARSVPQQAQASPPIQTSSLVKPSVPAQVNSSENVTHKKSPVAPVAPIYIPDRDMPTPKKGVRTTKLSEPGPPKVTPEKQRLMKALKLRKEQIAARTSVNGLGIKDVPEELNFNKPEIDDSILGAIIDASNPRLKSEPIPVATKDLAHEGSCLLEDSPISIPETTEEPSTQASSITDEEEAAAQKLHESHTTLMKSVAEHQNLSDGLSQDPHCHSIGKNETDLEEPEKDLLTEVAVIESPKNLSQSSASTQPAIFAVGQVAAELKVTGTESSDSEKHNHSHVMNGQVSIEETVVNEQLSPGHELETQTPRIQSPASDDAPSPFTGTTPTSELDKNSQSQRREPLGDNEKAAWTVEVVENEDLRSQSQRDGEEVEPTLGINDQARVLQSEFEEDYTQSPEHPVQDSEDFTPREAANDIVQPLLVRRSSSSKSITIPSDNVNAHEVPLPPIDEDEEISLSPQRVLFPEKAATPFSHSEGGSRTAMLQPEILSQNTEHMFTERSSSNDGGERHFRRQGAVNPIRRTSSPDRSDEQFLSDDSFMEELKSATVQEAKPVSVSKSPIKPVFSRSESEQKLNVSTKSSRSVSTPLDHSTNDREVLSSSRPPTPGSTSRSFSAQHAPRPDSQQSNVTITKKIGVSSSISQRIKALEQLSNRPVSPVSPKLAPNPSTFLGLRSTSLRSPSGGAEYSGSTSNRSNAAHSSPAESRETMKSSVPNSLNKVDCPHPTKSAKGTIGRDASERLPEVQSEPPHSSLHENSLQLEVPKSPPPTEQKAMGPPPLSPLKPPRPRFGRYSSTRSGSSSSSEQKLDPQPTTRRDSFASIRSKSSRAGSEVDLPRTLSDSSQNGMTGLESTQDEKKDSRRNRLLKHMSSISSVSRRSIAHALSPSPKEAPIIERQEPIQEAPSTSVDVGDVNIQFPDTLVSSCQIYCSLPLMILQLWKRRHMIVDAHGILILSAPISDNVSGISMNTLAGYFD